MTVFRSFIFKNKESERRVADSLSSKRLSVTPIPSYALLDVFASFVTHRFISFCQQRQLPRFSFHSNDPFITKSRPSAHRNIHTQNTQSFSPTLPWLRNASLSLTITIREDGILLIIAFTGLALLGGLFWYFLNQHTSPVHSIPSHSTLETTTRFERRPRRRHQFPLHSIPHT